MMRVASVKVSLDVDGMSSRIKKGNCLIDFTEIQHAFQADNEEVEIVMKSGDRFFAKNLTLVEIDLILNRLRQ
jgi:hypothetical protein